MNSFIILDCIDSDEMADARRRELDITRDLAIYRTRVIKDAVEQGMYQDSARNQIDWAIVSPRVPFIFSDTQQSLAERKYLDIITSTAPYAYTVGQPQSRPLLQSRIHRVLHIANALGYESLILGAWGCGAFGNDPATTAADFRSELAGEFRHCFSDVAFAITDWSPERRFLGPFRDAFAKT